MVSARVSGGPDGTKGLGLFLVPRLVDGAPNGFALRRLKYKLGTRSMPTGEIEFDGALGESIGPVEDGFKNLVSVVLDTSRVHNAVAACGIMRRAFAESHAYAAHRRAFGHRINEFPAVQAILARIKVRTMAALATTFRILAMSDRVDRDGATDQLVAARRIAVMINKYWTAVASTQVTRDAIELLGGNGTIEDFSVLPRLYRDAIVVESWEGTHNTLCAQVLRDFASRGLHRLWLAEMADELAAVDQPQVASQREVGLGLLSDVRQRVERLLAADPVTASAHIRHVVDCMCRVTDWVALTAQLNWELGAGEASETAAALDLYRLLFLDQADPQDEPRLATLARELGERT